MTVNSGTPANDMNILLIICDTLRADHLGCYGYFRDTSPNFDRLAREGVQFQRYYAAGVPTGLSFTSIHTGLRPIHHRVYNISPPDLVLDHVPTLAEILRAGGYRTVAFDNLAHCRTWCQDPVHFYRGFEHYICDVSNPRDWDAWGESVRAEWYTSRLIHWMESNIDEPFFAFVHLWDVHQPYVQPEPFRHCFRHEPGDLSDLLIEEANAGYTYVPGWGKLDEIYEEHGVYRKIKSWGGVPRREASIDCYDGAIRYLDQCIGEVLQSMERLNLLDRTLIMVTADHGELLGQHGLYGHLTAYEANVRIPLILRYPDRIPTGRILTGLASTIDLLPTITDLTKLTSPAGVDGKSLLPLLAGEPVHDRLVCDEGCGVRCLITDPWKLIHYYDDGTTELFHLRDDPMEVHDLASQRSDIRVSLEETLETWVAQTLAGVRKDPIEDVGRNFDRKFLYDRISMKNYLP